MTDKSNLRLLNLFVCALTFVALPIPVRAATAAETENRPGVTTAAEATTVISSLDAEDPKKTAFEEAIKTCKTQVAGADSACAASQNSNATSATSALNSSTGTSSSSIGSGCSDFSGLMSAIQPLMTNYASECTAARSKCPTSCNEQVKAVTSSCDTITGSDVATVTKQKAACKTNGTKAEAYAKSVATSCASYKQNSTQALAVLAGAAAAVASMLQCQEDVAATTTDTATTQCAYSTDPTNCTANDFGAGSTAAVKTANDATSADATALSSGLDSTPSQKSAKSTGLQPQSRGGGAGVSASGTAPVAKADTPAAKSLNTNIYSGDQGGGGAGGKSAATGGYPDVPDAAMNRALASAAARKNGIASQFTSGNGRSNWQKVRERYRDTGSTLGVVSNTP